MSFGDIGHGELQYCVNVGFLWPVVHKPKSERTYSEFRTEPVRAAALHAHTRVKSTLGLRVFGTSFLEYHKEVKFLQWERALLWIKKRGSHT